MVPNHKSMLLRFFVWQSLAKMPGKMLHTFLLLPPLLKDEAVLPPEVIELPEHQPHGGGALMYLFVSCLTRTRRRLTTLVTAYVFIF